MGILHKPDALFLDEPTTGLDPQNRANLWEHIRRLKAAGMTVLLTTHYLEEADELCDRLCIMDKGVIITEGTPAALKRAISGDVVSIRTKNKKDNISKIFTHDENVLTIRAEGEKTNLYVKDGAIVPSVFVILIARLFGFHIHLLGLFFLFVLLSFLVALISAWAGGLGLIIKQIGGLSTVLNLLQLPLTLLSGILLPMSLAPKWLQVIAHINPLYYTVEASRVLASGTINSPEVFTAFAVIVPLTIITLCWATHVYRKAIA